jgi:hypothetical protein
VRVRTTSPRLRPVEPGATFGIESASRGRQWSLTGQGSLPGCLARGIDIKNDVAPTLSAPQTANAFRCPPIRETVLLEERAEGF